MPPERAPPECLQDKGDGDGFSVSTPLLPAGGHWGQGGGTNGQLQKPWPLAGQQTGLVVQPGLCTQEGAEQDVLPEEAGLLQHLLKAPPHVLPVNHLQCALLWCGVLGWQC